MEARSTGDTECPKSGGSCRSEVGWSGMKGMFMSSSRACPRSRDSSRPRSMFESLGFTGRDSSLVRDILFWEGASMNP